ncbi:MAG: FAD-binding oxidoreductase, partial [Aquamicrobium sp.]|nr:FAD-binding oxidoreductase [Aquamicrobium sp.]
MPYQPLQDPPAKAGVGGGGGASKVKAVSGSAGEAKVDVAVIGGGITGVSAALH